MSKKTREHQQLLPTLSVDNNVVNADIDANHPSQVMLIDSTVPRLIFVALMSGMLTAGIVCLIEGKRTFFTEMEFFDFLRECSNAQSWSIACGSSDTCDCKVRNANRASSPPFWAPYEYQCRSTFSSLPALCLYDRIGAICLGIASCVLLTWIGLIVFNAARYRMKWLFGIWLYYLVLFLIPLFLAAGMFLLFSVNGWEDVVPGSVLEELMLDACNEKGLNPNLFCADLHPSTDKSECFCKYPKRARELMFNTSRVNARCQKLLEVEPNLCPENSYLVGGGILLALALFGIVCLGVVIFKIRDRIRGAECLFTAALAAVADVIKLKMR